MSDSHEIGSMGVPIGQQSVGARAEFITRTYNHLMGAIVVFIGIELLLFGSGLAQGIAQTMLSGSWLLVLGAFMIVSWMASRVAASSESMAAQYAALGAFVVFEAILFVPMLFIADQTAPGVIQSAAVVTLLGFAGLTAIVFVTRKDFSFLRSMLMFGGVLAIVAIIGASLFGFELGTWFSVAMVGFAGGAILHDTSNVMLHYPEDRYVAAALALFASVALLFWYVLRLFMSRD
jgi:hypothetical protein